MSETSLAPYRVTARNTAIASENKIHDDTVARRFGFAGGLVPGVEVYAYMTHAPVEHWGRAWLEHGSAECRFIKPIYDGQLAVVTGKVADAGLDLAVESEAGLCATGHAGLAAGSATSSRYAPRSRQTTNARVTKWSISRRSSWPMGARWSRASSTPQSGARGRARLTPPDSSARSRRARAVRDSPAADR